MYSALFVIFCYFLGGFAGVLLGILVERIRWNQRIEAGDIPRPYNLKKSKTFLFTWIPKIK